MIEELTLEQTAQLPIYRDKWIEIGRSTERTDRPLAEQAIKKAYECAELPPPKIVHWTRSPYEGTFKAAQIHTGKEKPDSEELRHVLNNACFGSQEAYWLSFYEFFQKECNVDLSMINGLTESAQHCGWFWPFEDEVVISEKPIGLHIDAEKRLHCEDGMAIYYSDGWGIWMWHGVPIPQRLIEHPESYTAAEILGEQNLEVRRCMIEKIGIEALLDAATEIKKDVTGTLYQIEVPNDETIKFVKVVNSTVEPDGVTYKNYYLRVPPTMRTAKQAVAWTFGKKSKEYLPALET